MNEHDRDLDLLEAILGYCEQAEEAIRFFGDDEEQFRSNSVFLNAVSMCLLQIGELAGRLSEEFRSAHTDIPWRETRALRNVLAHNYFSVDADVAWAIVHDDLPVLRSFCASFRERE